MKLILLMTQALRERLIHNRVGGASTNPQVGGEAPRSARRARAEADEVRAMAAAHLRNDPGFASELFAAADRHEQLALPQV